uniref:WRKY domain-containing protein n=1 Tax=Oryza brachyantha TaxID=4533 RepID=J3L5B0_ORYBR
MAPVGNQMEELMLKVKKDELELVVGCSIELALKTIAPEMQLPENTDTLSSRRRVPVEEVRPEKDQQHQLPKVRSYYRCSYYRERRCPAQKHVQQRNGDDVPAMYVVVYIHEHTCQAALGELPDAANSSGGGAAAPGYFPAGETSPSSLRRWGAAQVLVGRPPPQLVDERAAMEERERQVLVSSLARVLQGQQCYDDESHGVVVAAVVHAPVAAPVSASSSELPVRPDHGEELDVKDYDVTDALLWGPFGGTVDSNSYGQHLTSTRCFEV